MLLGRIERLFSASVISALIFVPTAFGDIITELTPPSGYTTGSGEAINANGQVAVTLYTAPDFDGVSEPATALYSGGSFKYVAAGNGKGSGSSLLAGINSSGATVGTYLTGVEETEAFYISATGKLTTLKNLNTGSLPYGSWAFAINDSGTVVGSSYTSNNAANHPVSWNSSTGKVTDLGVLGSGYGAYGAAYAINSAGTIVGTAGAATNNLAQGYAFVYSGGKMTAIGGLLQGYSDAFAINNSGEIVGDETVDANGDLNAFIDISGAITDIETIDLQPNSSAYSVNSSGEVVGAAYTLDANGDVTTSDAFLYDNGTMIDLDTLLPANSGWVLQSANAINDSGQITGYGLYDGQEEAFVLDTEAPVPEPGTLMLACVGLGITACLRIRARGAFRTRS